MQKWNLKHVSVYTAAIIALTVYSLIFSSLSVAPAVILAYQKILFAAPLLFIIAAFLAFRIAETGIVIIALSFLVLSLSTPLMQVLSLIETPAISGRAFGFLFSPDTWVYFIKILPLILPVSLSLLFLIPEKIGRFSMTFIKVILALFPFTFLFFPDYFEAWFFKEFQYGRFLFPWPSLVASVIPLAGPYLYSDRRSRTFSAALTSSLILFLLPVMLSLDGYLRDTSCLFAGMILLHSLYRVYWENSYIDELTGLLNRRALDEKLRRLRSGYSLSMADVDHFKNFNDTYGHDEGDNVLRLVGKILFTHFGKSAFRYGGEEFCIVFMKTDAETAAMEMDEARRAIEEHMFSIRQNVKNRKKSARQKSSRGVKKVKLTVSAGIAAPGKSRRDALSVLKNADKALYAAKEGGRNRVEINNTIK